MLKKIIRNCSLIVVVASVTFLLHWGVASFFNLKTSFNELGYSYLINSLMAFGVISLIFLLENKLSHQLGFVFMASSLFKFAIFFLLFYPYYNADGNITKVEFVIFFIPYAICLITECIILSRFLNGLNPNK